VKTATAFAPGWYFYDAASTTRIGFCPDACAAISIEGDGSVTVVTGCVDPGPNH